jgi:hypothetical protein
MKHPKALVVILALGSASLSSAATFSTSAQCRDILSDLEQRYREMSARYQACNSQRTVNDVLRCRASAGNTDEMFRRVVSLRSQCNSMRLAEEKADWDRHRRIELDARSREALAREQAQQPRIVMQGAAGASGTRTPPGPIVLPGRTGLGPGSANTGDALRLFRDIVTGRDSHDDEPPEDTPQTNRLYETVNREDIGIRERTQQNRSSARDVLEGLARGGAAETPSASREVQDRALILLRRYQEHFERTFENSWKAADEATRPAPRRESSASTGSLQPRRTESEAADPARVSLEATRPGMLDSNPWAVPALVASGSPRPSPAPTSVPVNRYESNPWAEQAPIATAAGDEPGSRGSQAKPVCSDSTKVKFRWRDATSGRSCFSNTGVRREPFICC